MYAITVFQLKDHERLASAVAGYKVSLVRLTLVVMDYRSLKLHTLTALYALVNAVICSTSIALIASRRLASLGT